MKDFNFVMFHNKTKFCKKEWNNIIIAEKVHIRNWKQFVLRDEKTIVNKQKNRNRNF